jgi:hypothetical protein
MARRAAAPAAFRISTRSDKETGSAGPRADRCPTLHLHDLRHTGNTLAAQSGASLHDLITRMGHDSPAAALIYQHSSRVADEAIVAALDSRSANAAGPECRGPVEGPTQPQLIAVEPGRSRKRASNQGSVSGADDGNRTRTVSLGS